MRLRGTTDCHFLRLGNAVQMLNIKSIGLLTMLATTAMAMVPKEDCEAGAKRMMDTIR